MLNPERFWSDRPVMAAARIGFPVGALFGAFQTVTTGSVVAGLVAAVFFGTCFGGIMAWLMRRAWRRSSELAPEDRVAVARAVYRGEEIQDVRLAGAVIDYAGVVRQACERDARGRWVLVVFAVMTVILAISATAAGSTWEAAAFWVLSAFWVAGLGWIIPRRRARMLANAHRAELAARSRRSASGPV
jgi:positive regulator of sigma E activity